MTADPAVVRSRGHAIRSLDWRDLAFALGTAAIALSVYLRTLYPGVGGGGDATKFQYMGSVLGTAHPPGYPLYIFVSYAFSHLPFGSPAYRINFMSAFFAAIAVACVYAMLARLGCRRLVASGAALALAFDRVLWSKAVGAEVYTLGGALTALTALAAIRWASTQRDRDLYLTVGVFALSLGNHLTVATIAPALLLFVLVVRPRTVAPRTIAVSAFLLLLGLAQYGFIILRTRQHAPYLEAQATNVHELYETVRATRFADEIGIFSWGQLLHERVPALSRLFLSDLTPAAIAMLGLGFIGLIWRRLSAGVLLTLGAAGIIVLTLNVDADVEGFIVPALVLCWVVVGIGMDVTWSALARAGRPMTVAAALAVAAFPLWQLARNYKVNDHHRRTYEIHYLNALFAQLEPRVAFIHEAYPIDQLLLYKLAAEHAAGTREVTIIQGDLPTVERYANDRFAVYAFSEGRAALQGRGFDLEPVLLRDQPTADAPPIDMALLPLFRVARRASCLPIGNQGWQDVTRLVSAGQMMLRLDNYRPFDSTVAIYAAGPALVGPPALVIAQGVGDPSFTAMTYHRSSSQEAERLSMMSTRDGMPDNPALRAEAVVHRAEYTVNDDGKFNLSALEFGGPPRIALVRASVDLNNPLRATACGSSIREFFASDTQAVERVVFSADGDALFGQGWMSPDNNGAGTYFRWMSRDRADVLVPVARDGAAVHVRLRAVPFGLPADVPYNLALAVNGISVGARPLVEDWTVYEWDLPADRLLRGFNRLTIEIGRAADAPAVKAMAQPKAPRVAVRELEFTRRETADRGVGK